MPTLFLKTTYNYIMSEFKHRSIKISPIRKQYPSKFQTQESSLAKEGYVRSPGTKMVLTPKKEADNRYRTGVDPKAQYIKSIRDEGELAAELKLIDDLLSQLKEVYGEEIDFGPRSKVWMAFSDEPVKVSPVILSNSDLVLNTSNSQDLLTYCWLRKYPSIAKSLESYNRGDCPDCQYYLADDDAESRILFSKKKQINKAIVQFEKLTPTKAKQVARLMGLPISDNSTEEFVYNQMDTLLKQPEFEKGDYEGLSTISVFNDIVALTDDRIATKDLVEQAIRHNMYRVGAGGKLMEGNTTIQASKEDFVNFLLEPANQKELLALESRVKAKKINEA